MKKVSLLLICFLILPFTIFSGCGGGGGGGTAGSTTDTPPSGPTLPNAPSNITVVTGNVQATVSWSSVTGATSYNIYWSATSGVNKSTGTKISNVTGPYTHMGLTKGSVYYYVVTSINDAGESAESVQVAATTNTTPTGPTLPNAPLNITAVTGNAQATVSWASVTGATSYNIYWSATSGVNKSTGTKISNVTGPYTHTGLTNGSVYYYVVTSINAVGESTESVQVAATLTLVVGSSRSTPYARTQVAVTPNREVQVVDIVRGTSAWNTILATNQFNTDFRGAI